MSNDMVTRARWKRMQADATDAFINTRKDKISNDNPVVNRAVKPKTPSIYENVERDVQFIRYGLFATGVATVLYFINSCLRGGKKNSRRRKRKGGFVGGDSPDDSSQIPDSETIDKAIEIFNKYPGLLNVIKDQTCPLNPELKEGMMEIKVLLEPLVKNGGRKSRRSRKTRKNRTRRNH